MFKILFVILMVFAGLLWWLFRSEDEAERLVEDVIRSNMRKREVYLKSHKPVFGDGKRTYWDYIYGDGK